jgi:hypothetical protein
MLKDDWIASQNKKKIDFFLADFLKWVNFSSF